MTTMALLLSAILAVAVVLVVARPFLREPAPADDHLESRSEPELRRLALAEERDRLLAALKELEFDHRTGKVSDADYRAEVGPLRRRVAEVLRALEPGAQAPQMLSVPEPYPPPDEGTPPAPALVPEPEPPPDEGTPPQPDPVPTPGREG